MVSLLARFIPAVKRRVDERDFLRGIGSAWRILHHQPRRETGIAAVVPAINEVPDDQRLVARIIAAYRKAIRTPVGPTTSMWLGSIQQANKAAHLLLENGDNGAVACMLRDPASSMLMYGFDSIHKADVSKITDLSWWTRWLKVLTYDSLLQITRAIGLRRVENLEPLIDLTETPDVETLLSELDDAFGFRICFPNPFAGEVGVQTSRGIASYRAVQALYQAWRIVELGGG